MNIEHLLTPYKYGKPVITGTGDKGRFDCNAVDCPTPFWHNGRYYMLFVGFDGTGYQTGLAVSDDLINWVKLGAILRRGSNMLWDNVGMAGTSVLMENDLFGQRKLKKVFGRYWLLYHSYPNTGYEAGAAEIGLAWTEDENLLDWHFRGEPILSWKDGEAWEHGGLYKGWLLEHEGKFYMFYNAKTDENERGWIEQTGFATSTDLMNWTRNPSNPVLPVSPGAWDSVFASDPTVFYDSRQRQWVMFYYGLGNLSACEGLAVSKNLSTWQKFPIPILTIGTRKSIDQIHAHKPGIIYADGKLYHFYCACRPTTNVDVTAPYSPEHRCITVARDVPWTE
jgi:predicted GH43/DUF377 family glycosyl hydrolase